MSSAHCATTPMKWYENSRVRMRAFRSRAESGRSGLFREISEQPATHASTAAAANNRARGRVCVPTPVTHQRHIFAVVGDVLAMFDQPVLHFVLEIVTAAGELRQAIDDVLD